MEKAVRLVDEYGHIHCTLMVAKARVAPRRFASIPRLELVAAISTRKISTLIKKELEMEELTKFFLTDRKKLFWVILPTILEPSKDLQPTG